MGDMQRLLIALLPISALAAGCASEVETRADERAQRAGVVMDRVRDGSAADMARRVVGGDPAQDTAIEALVADGDRARGRIVLRITERRATSDFDVQPSEAVRCYEYELRRSVDELGPHRIDCPEGPALSLGPPPPVTTLPAGVDDALRRELESLDADRLSEAAVLRAARAVAGAAPVVDVATHDGVIGVVVGDGALQCVAGSVHSDGVVAVWRVPEVVAQPGELGCSASAAARGLGTRHPH